MRYGKKRKMNKKKKKRNATYAERTTFNWMLVFHNTLTHRSRFACTFTISLTLTRCSFSYFLLFFFTPENFLYRKYKWFKPKGQKLKPPKINWQIISRKRFHFSRSIYRLTISRSLSLFLSHSVAFFHSILFFHHFICMDVDL